MDITIGDTKIGGLASINVILGKNGSGKSTLLRKIDEHQQNHPTKVVQLVKYISPERGGDLDFDANVENQMQNNARWPAQSRRRNLVPQFRNMSMVEYRDLKGLVQDKIEKDPKIRSSSFSFDDIVSVINGLLDNIKIVRAGRNGLQFHGKNGPQDSATLSSGEKELISLSIEILSFVYQVDLLPKEHGKHSLLLLDEPDVHLHPDLQYRLIQLLSNELRGKPIVCIITTHSTALLAALDSASSSVAFLTQGSKDLTFVPISDTLRSVLPIFGAHPLSNIFNLSPIFLVEGDDDVRIWQQVVRSSGGKVKIWPCAAGSKNELGAYEEMVMKLVGSVYENANAYSLRDRDDEAPDIDDLAFITRFRLRCRTAENLILSNEVLALLGTDWSNMQGLVQDWLSNNPSHKQYAEMNLFAIKFDRINANIKTLRNLFIGLAGSEKPWEVAVGQAIASLNRDSLRTEGSLACFLGPKLVGALGICS